MGRSNTRAVVYHHCRNKIVFVENVIQHENCVHLFDMERHTAENRFWELFWKKTVYVFSNRQIDQVFIINLVNQLLFAEYVKASARGAHLRPARYGLLFQMSGYNFSETIG